MPRKLISFDLETCPLDNAFDLMPEFEAPKNLKDPLKIDAAIAEKQNAWVEKLALSPDTGRIAAIGVLGDDFQMLLAQTKYGETELLLKFWDLWSEAQGWGAHFVGWNIQSFDLPFLYRRSIALGIEMPPPIAHGRPLYDCNMTDVKLCVDPWNKFDIKFLPLDAAARTYLGYGKSDKDVGKDWLNIYNEAPKRAEAYLIEDCQLTLELAKKFIPSRTWSEYVNQGRDSVGV